MILKSDSIKNLADALCKVQATLENAKKTSDNPFFKSKYADLAECWEACRKPLSENGLSISQLPDFTEDGRAFLHTMLMHVSGEWIASRLPLQLVKNDPQAQGSAITYARRYTLSAIVGIATEDDDGESAMNRAPRPQIAKRVEKPAPKKPQVKNGPVGDTYLIPVGMLKGKDINGVDAAVLLSTVNWYETNVQESKRNPELVEFLGRAKAILEGGKD